ncbi:hypothetical protein GJV85_01410 [Sulfurimonas aquatica]|uniref:WGR domain-containing protein n=1 Tax=Sulfurimonas aquatica TaxID=2672570 RepID=A0A975AYC2_9BACT|nr:hypothetical protein [Sulfurimonas aquatica]QSZ40826.1 hypothetical protein GJV85_01410 [Sulfurimonas aquatica]
MILFKNSNERSYYYKINIYPTLFGDFLIQKEYGATQNSKPTNTIKEYVNSKKEALCLLLDIVIDKKSLGYLKTA